MIGSERGDVDEQPEGEASPVERHWSHVILWPISKRAYCRYWSARLAWRTCCAMIEAGKARRGIAWLVFLVELVRPKQTIQMRVTQGGQGVEGADQ